MSAMPAKLRLAAPAAAILVVATPTAFAAQSGPDFIRMAIQGDNTELMLGQLAQQKGSTVEVRSFGQTLVQDHMAAKQAMSDAARQSNAQAGDTLSPDAEALKAKLSGLSGMAFDGAFADALVNDHEKDIALYRDEANANAGAASTLAARQLPVLEKHFRMAQDIRKSMAGGALVAKAGEPSGFLAEEGDRWRGSKLIGVNIYGPNDQKVGDINDVLVGRDGRVEYVIIGVGGFLGIGEKDVAIPFARVSFSQETMAAARRAGTGAAPASPGMASNSTGAGMQGGAASMPAGSAPVGNAMSGTTMVGGLGNPQAGMGGAAAMRERSMAWPDHGLIDYTADQLKSAPTFNYAR